MEHLPFLFFSASILLGFAFIGVLWMLWHRYPHPLLRYHFFQHIATTLYIVLQSASLYGFINTRIFNSYLNALEVFTIGSLIFVGFVIYFQSRSIYFLMNIKWDRKVNLAFLCISSFSPAVSLYMFQTGMSQVLTMAAMGSWLLTQVYLILRLALNYKKITDPLMKLIARTFFIIFLVSFPIAWIDFKVQESQIAKQQYPVGIMSGPLIYIIEIAFVIYILLEAGKKIKQKNTALPQHFLLKFNPTDREKEIIQLLCNGLTNKEIASKLFLSPATVRNHISNIFQKTNTPNRGKLISLIQNQP